MSTSRYPKAGSPLFTHLGQSTSRPVCAFLTILPFADFPGKELVRPAADFPVRQPAVCRAPAKPTADRRRDEIPDKLIAGRVGGQAAWCRRTGRRRRPIPALPIAAFSYRSTNRAIDERPDDVHGMAP